MKSYDIVDSEIRRKNGLEGDVGEFLSKTSFFQYWSPAVRDRWVAIFENVKLGV